MNKKLLELLNKIGDKKTEIKNLVEIWKTGRCEKCKRRAEDYAGSNSIS